MRAGDFVRTEMIFRRQQRRVWAPDELRQPHQLDSRGRVQVPEVGPVQLTPERLLRARSEPGLDNRYFLFLTNGSFVSIHLKFSVRNKNNSKILFLSLSSYILTASFRLFQINIMILIFVFCALVTAQPIQSISKLSWTWYGFCRQQKKEEGEREYWTSVRWLFEVE